MAWWHGGMVAVSHVPGSRYTNNETNSKATPTEIGNLCLAHGHLSSEIRFRFGNSQMTNQEICVDWFSLNLGKGLEGPHPVLLTLMIECISSAP